MASAVLQILIYSLWTNLLVVLFQAMDSKMRSSPAQQCQAHKTTEKQMTNWVVTCAGHMICMILYI